MLRYEQLVIEEASTPPVDVTAAGQMLYEKAQEAGLEVWSSSSPELERLLARMEFASIYSESIAPRDLVLRTALRNCAAGLTSFAELRTAVANGGLFSFVLAEIDSRVLDQIAPSHIALPSGRRARIDYALGKPPSVSSRLQDFIGLRQTPVVADGRMPLTLCLLAPNRRPVQVTTDLGSFWTNLYPRLRRELKPPVSASSVARNSGVILQDFFENRRNLEQRLVTVLSNSRTYSDQFALLQKAMNGTFDAPKVAENLPVTLLPNPFGVVPFLGKRPRIPFDYYRQSHLQSFRDASRPRLSDEEIRYRHESGNLFCKSNRNDFVSGSQAFQSRAQLLALAANHDKLQRELGIPQTPRDANHGLGAFSPKHDESSGQLWIEAQLAAFIRAIPSFVLIKYWSQDHAAHSTELPRFVVHLDRLLICALRSTNQILSLTLHPEVRRIICQVRENCDIRSCGSDPLQTFEKRAVQIRNQRNHHVRLSRPPEFAE